MSRFIAKVRFPARNFDSIEHINPPLKHQKDKKHTDNPTRLTTQKTTFQTEFSVRTENLILTSNSKASSKQKKFHFLRFFKEFIYKITLS